MGRKKKYIPKPLDTSKINLPDRLNDLMEAMSENIHENWSQMRMDQGWRFGKERNDKQKLHPCLVAYDELPEIEKEYDRQTATETLKFILAEGFEISSKENVNGICSIDYDEVTFLSLRELIRLLNSLKLIEEESPETFLKLGDIFFDRREKVLAFEAYQAGIRRVHEGDNAIFRDLYFGAALSLADCYAFREAAKLLDILQKNGYHDGDITGQAAKIAKNMAFATGDSSQLLVAKETYRHGYEKGLKDKKKKNPNAIDDAIYNGINFATVLMLDGDKEESIKIAKDIVSLCETKNNLSHWDYASIAEAYLLQRKLSLAISYYKQAAITASSGAQVSMKKQALLVASKLKLRTDDLLLCFKQHRLFLTNFERLTAYVDATQYILIEKQVIQQFKAFNPDVLVCTLMHQLDISIVRLALKMGVEVDLYLPCEPEYLSELGEWNKRIHLKSLQKIISKVRSCTITAHKDNGLNEVSRQFNQTYMEGIASYIKKHLEVKYFTSILESVK